MKKYAYYLFALLLGIFLLSFSGGAPNGYTGADNNITCSSNQGGCHAGPNYAGSMELDFKGVTIFEQGVTYPLSVTMCYGQMSGGTTPVRAGFSMTARDLSNQSYGSFAAGQNTSLGSNNHIRHSPAQPFGTDSCVTYDFQYTAPSMLTSSAPIFFSAASVIGGNDQGNQNDQVIALSNPLEILLPLELHAFEVKVVGSLNRLKWTTASEYDTESFVIQRSVNSEQWENIGRVQAAGQSNKLLSYTFEDVSPITHSMLYYRLQMNDLDGKFEYSEIKSIRHFEKPDFSEVGIYPNPVKKGNHVSISCIPDEAASARLVYSNGMQRSIDLNQPDIKTVITEMSGLTSLVIENELREVIFTKPFIVVD
jgi:hypothetical protein